jgi:hypothetical protein
VVVEVEDEVAEATVVVVAEVVEEVTAVEVVEEVEEATVVVAVAVATAPDGSPFTDSCFRFVRSLPGPYTRYHYTRQCT